MIDPNVQPEVSLSEPSVWLDIAEELRKLARDCENLVGEPGPSMFELNVQPRPHNNVEALAAVDTIALGLLGKRAETKDMGGGTYHRTISAQRGPVGVAVFRRVPDPAAVDPTEELTRLREENERLREAAGLNQARDDEGQGPLPTTRRVEPHLEDARNPGVAIKDGYDLCRAAGYHVPPCELYRPES
jgi:hypothetical protein